MARRIIPNNCGADLVNRSKTEDAHIRLEGRRIVVDLFNYKVRNHAKAHITSEGFPNTAVGARHATNFLQDDGFNVRLTRGVHRRC